MSAGLHSEEAKVAHVIVARVVRLLPFRQIEIDLVGYAGVRVVLDAVEANHRKPVPESCGRSEEQQLASLSTLLGS